MSERIWTMEELDTLLEHTDDLWCAVGLKVAYMIDEEDVDVDVEVCQTYLVPHRGIGLRMTEFCMDCGEPEELYLCRATNGEWALFYKQDGTFVTDVRERPYYCDKHPEQEYDEAFVNTLVHTTIASLIKSMPSGSTIIIQIGGEEEDEGNHLLHRPPAGQNKEMLN